MRKQFSSWSHLAFISTASACNLFGCAAKVEDLGNSDSEPAAIGPIYSTGVPTAPANAGTDSGVMASGMSAFRIVDMEQTGCENGGGWGCPTSSFMVDSGRLFWVSPSIDPTDQEFSYYLRSCDVDNCAGTLTSSTRHREGGYATSSRMHWMQKVGDQVYWQSINLWAVMTANSAPGAVIASIGSPIGLSGNPLADGGFIYGATSENTLLRCDPSDCADTTERFAMTPPSGVQPLQSGSVVGNDDNYLYLVDNPMRQNGPRLLRITKDVSASFEVVLPDMQTTLGAFSVHGDSLYWVENIDMGQLLSYPKSGGNGSPTVLLTGLNDPTDLAVDDAFAYVLEPPVLGETYVDENAERTVSRPGRILKCPLTGCSTPTIIYTTTDAFELDKIMVDDRFVYVRGNYCTSDDEPSARCGFIAAIPK